MKTATKKPAEPPTQIKPPSAYETLMKVRSKLQHLTMEWSPITWLNTGDALLNAVLGREDRGIPYGRIIEISGMESGGKTALALHLASKAQKDGAVVIWMDFEVSFDPEWATTRGLDVDSLYLIQPYVGTFGKDKKSRLASAEELCAEVGVLMNTIHTKDPHSKICLVVDSIASMLVGAEMNAGLENRNLRSSMALPKFLGALLREWVGTAQSYSAIIVLINQLRENPMQMFGDPLYTPGGNAPKFFAHIRVRAKRAKGGRIPQGGKTVGIQGILSNLKNKAGGVERAKVGYKIFFDGNTVFLDADKLEKDEG